MNLKKLFFASALLFAACGTIQAQEVIAHRGFLDYRRFGSELPCRTCKG